MERERTVLPEPDSPTTPSVSPRRSVSETPSTAGSGPLGVMKVVRRSRTSRRIRFSSTPTAASATGATAPLVLTAPFGELEPLVLTA